MVDVPVGNYTEKKFVNTTSLQKKGSEVAYRNKYYATE